MEQNKHVNRRAFIKKTMVTSVGLSLSPPIFGVSQSAGRRVGIIGLDTSHSMAFTKALNSNKDGSSYKGFHVVAAYPYGSKTIASSADRIPGYIADIQNLGVTISSSIQELLREVDVVLLETNDGRLHLEQAMEVFQSGKKMFIDKPIAASLADSIAIFQASEKFGIPVFSASSLRFIGGMKNLDKSKVVGADTFSPASVESTHPDLFWYGIHGVETLFTAMGTGCEQVTRIHTPETDIVVGTWKDGRVGTFRGTRSGKAGFGGTIYTVDGPKVLGPYGGYEPLLEEIVTYFETGKVPVSPAETLEIVAFMEAADLSKKRQGKPVTLSAVMASAMKKVK